MENKNNKSGIVVDDGRVKEYVTNRYGEKIGIFYFNPSDLNIIERYNKVVKDFSKITEPLRDVDINSDGSTNDDISQAKMDEAKKRLFEACDYLFGGNLSEAFFAKVHPFSPVNGRFYCENAIESVGDYISNCFDKELSKIDNRVNQYVHGYRTGKHKNGGKKKSGR